VIKEELNKRKKKQKDKQKVAMSRVMGGEKWKKKLNLLH
jgi:hypothetical protein